MSKVLNPNVQEKFIEMYLMGMKMTDITSTLGIDRTTGYNWLKNQSILDEIDSRQQEIKDAGMQFIKSRYLKYLQNIDKLCDNFEDKRTTLSSNEWMLEKMDGKNVAKIEDVTPDTIKVSIIKEDKSE